jgi:hypothetical protein
MRQNRSDAGSVGSVESGKLKFGYGEGMSTAPPEFIELYRVFRTMESREKARLFGSKNGVLVGSLLDRRLCLYEISQIFGAIKDIVLGSELSQKAKEVLLNRLANCVEIELIAQPPEPTDPPVPKEKPDSWTAYMFERLNEVAARAENFRLRADKLESGLLTRNLFQSELAQVVAVIELVIQRSRLCP